MRQKMYFTWVAGLLLMLVAGAALAQRVEGDRAAAQGLYGAEVQVSSQSDSERKEGLARALAQALGKISGNPQAANQPGVAEALADAEQYVDSFDYRQDEGVSASGAPTYRTMLVVHFDAEAITGLASALGLSVWPQPRPKPVLWLAIDDGSGPRLVGTSQSSVAKSLTSRAIERGFKLGLPSGNAAEQAIVGAIWRGDTAAVARTSARYRPPMQLIGKLYRSNGGWTADWIFVDDGQVLSRWSVDNPDARQALASGADGAADALVKRYARAADVGPPGKYRVLFSGIGSTMDFLNLSAYLQGLPMVRGIVPLRATTQGLEVELQLSTGLSGLRRMVGADAVLEAVGEGEPATFRLRR